MGILPEIDKAPKQVSSCQGIVINFLIDTNEEQADLDSDHSIDLPDLFSGATLWGTDIIWLRSILLDEAYPRLQQRDLDGVGDPPLCDSGYGYVTPSRSENHPSGPVR